MFIFLCSYVVSQKLCGEAVTLMVLREGSKIECTVLLSSVPKLIPSLANIDYEPSYAILGGLVFLPCGRPLERQAKAMKLR